MNITLLITVTWCAAGLTILLAWHLAARHHKNKPTPREQATIRQALNDDLALIETIPGYRSLYIPAGPHPCGCIITTRRDGVTIVPCTGHALDAELRALLDTSQ